MVAVMEGLFRGSTVFHIAAMVVFWVSPVIFIIGLFLILTAEKYTKLEEKLGKEIGGIKKRIFPKIETNIYTFHQWLLNRKVVVGFFYISCTLLFFFSAKYLINP